MIARFVLTVDTHGADVDLVRLGEEMLENWQYEGVFSGFLNGPELVSCVPERPPTELTP